VRYPVVYIQNHFSLSPPFGFNPMPAAEGKVSWGQQCAEARAKNLPSPELPTGATATGAYSNVETGAEFARSWMAADFPRMILVTFQHPTPYFDDSYGINSPNCGPYGDAIMQELIPELESRFRTIKAGYARVLTGSSTGGWGSLALQLYHPDFFGGAWAFSRRPGGFSSLLRRRRPLPGRKCVRRKINSRARGRRGDEPSQQPTRGDSWHAGRPL